MNNVSLLPSFVVEQGLVNTCLTRGADFEAYTGPMQADQTQEDRYIVNMIGSSTVKDLQGDAMAMSALDDMTNIPDNLTILMNHDMTIPDSVFGGLYGRPWIKSQGGIADFHLAAEVETSNPKAVQTYTMIVRGRRLGCSIGCLVVDYEYDEDTGTLVIKRVLPVEYSVVGVPAQQRCWVEVATKSLFERSLIEGNADKALKLAPAVRGMYSKSYKSLVSYVESTSLRNDLERIRPRETAQRRIMCSFSDDKIGFLLSDGKGITKSLTRDEVSSLFKQKDTIEADDLAKKEKDGDGVLSTENGGEALVRQDLGEKPDEDEDEKDGEEEEKGMKAKKDQAANVKIAADGNHDVFTGKHTHAHKAYGAQGDDDMHTHEHSHDDDAHHGHHDDSEKTATPPVQKSVEEEGQGEGETTDPTTPPPAGEEQPAPETPASSEEGEGEEENVEGVLLAKLSLYNDLGESIHLPMVPWEVFASYRQMPQHDQESEDQALMLLLSFLGNIKLAEGRTVSAATGVMVTQIHDLAATLHPPCCSCFQQEQDNGESGGQDEDDATKATPPVDVQALLSSEKLLELAQDYLAPFISETRKDLDAARAESQRLQATNTTARAELKALTDQIARVARMPLGRPTSLTRRVDPQREASYQDMLAAGSQGTPTGSGDQPALTTLAETLAELAPYTRVLEKQVYASGGLSLMKYRHWPVGVGGAVGSSNATSRPALTAQQKMFMLAGDWEAYAAGQAADVPMIDDPFETGV